MHENTQKQQEGFIFDKNIDSRIDRQINKNSKVKYLIRKLWLYEWIILLILIWQFIILYKLFVIQTTFISTEPFGYINIIDITK